MKSSSYTTDTGLCLQSLWFGIPECKETLLVRQAVIIFNLCTLFFCHYFFFNSIKIISKLPFLQSLMLNCACLQAEHGAALETCL